MNVSQQRRHRVFSLPGDGAFPLQRHEAFSLSSPDNYDSESTSDAMSDASVVADLTDREAPTPEANVRYYDYDSNDPAYQVPMPTMVGRRSDTKQFKRVEFTIAQNTAKLADHQEGLKDGYCLICADMVEGPRSSNAVKAVTAIGLDHDLGKSIETTVAALRSLDCLAILHTTHSHAKTRTEFKKDRIVKWAKNTDIKNDELIQRFLREDQQWDEAIVASATYGDEKHVAKGIMVYVDHAPLPKYRVIVPLAEPFVIASEGDTQSEAQTKWAKVPVALAKKLGLPIDMACRDVARLFYFPRHAKGSPYDVRVFGGPLFDWRSLELDDYGDALANALNRGQSKSKTDAGRALGKWWTERADGFQIVQVIEEKDPDRIKGDATTGKTIECPFADDHTDPDPDDTGCYAVNAADGTYETCFVRCQHNSCHGKTTLDHIGKMIEDGWFEEAEIWNPDYDVVVRDDIAAEASEPKTKRTLGKKLTKAMRGYTDTPKLTPAMVRDTINALGQMPSAELPNGVKPTAEELAPILSQIEAVENDTDRDLLFDSACECWGFERKKKVVENARTRAKADWKERRHEEKRSKSKAVAPLLPLPNLRVPKDVTCRETGEIDDTFSNCLTLLDQAHSDWRFAFNTLTLRHVLRNESLPWAKYGFGCEIDDEAIRVIRHFLITQWGVSFSKADVTEACFTLARYATFNPVIEYLDSLEWDNVPRVETWLSEYLGAKDDQYTRAVGSLWLVAAVRRMKQPGCKFDNALFLEGPQGAGKSSAFRVLGGDYYSDAPLGDVETADAAMKLMGVWIHEMSELSTLSRATDEEMKAFASRTEDVFRVPYDRMPRTVRRQFVICGTGNGQNYLFDLTGNRRYWPAKTADKIDLDKLTRDRDQIWAEAAMMEATGMSIMLPEALWPVAAAEQADRVSDDPWTDTLSAYLEKVAERERDNDRVSTGELLEAALGIEPRQQSQALMKRLHGAMATIEGWSFKKSLRITETDLRGKKETRVRKGYQRDA